MKVKEKYYFDIPKDSDYFTRWDVLMIKNEYHRKILNRQPKRMIQIIDGKEYECMIIDFGILSN